MLHCIIVLCCIDLVWHCELFSHLMFFLKFCVRLYCYEVVISCSNQSSLDLTIGFLSSATPAYLSRYTMCRSFDHLALAFLCWLNLSGEPTFPYLVSAPAVWNSLPEALLWSPSLTLFKSGLKTRERVSPGFALPRQQWSLLNRFCTGQGHRGACKKKWKLSDSDQCSRGETQTMSHIVESCPQTRLHGGLSKLHSADDDAIAWLTSCGS